MTLTEPGFVPAPLDLGDVRLLPWGAGLLRYAPDVARIIADEEVALWNPIRETDPGAWILGHTADGASGDVAGFAVLDAASAALLGTVGLYWPNRADGQAAIGYRLLPEARGRGVATRATAAAARWAFTAAGARRIELCHAVGNTASCRVAERCGFPLEGTLRASHRYGDGRHHDEHLHARLAGDPEPEPFGRAR
ncbi:GNAT family N-acetyltransferase [Kitasatospora sp. NPDC085879]|uniref:GNAT family N-acetyltransferase n=1 Tax=Kitasatospora sp. NPDC085879 TaxID=3154769 RepID=UPI00341409F3